MGKFNYDYLKQAEREGRRIGGWKGIGVYSCAARNYNFTDDKYYVIYDDKNALVRNGKKYGYITENGDVKETAAVPWVSPSSKERTERVSETVIPASGEYSVTISSDEYFSRLDREINEFLAGVANIDLLKGLNFDG